MHSYVFLKHDCFLSFTVNGSFFRQLHRLLDKDNCTLRTVSHQDVSNSITYLADYFRQRLYCVKSLGFLDNIFSVCLFVCLFVFLFV